MNIWIRRKSTTNQYLQQNAYTDTCKIDENKNELDIFLSGIVLSINKQFFKIDIMKRRREEIEERRKLKLM